MKKSLEEWLRGDTVQHKNNDLGLPIVALHSPLDLPVVALAKTESDEEEIEEKKDVSKSELELTFPEVETDVEERGDLQIEIEEERQNEKRESINVEAESLFENGEKNESTAEDDFELKPEKEIEPEAEPKMLISENLEDEKNKEAFWGGKKTLALGLALSAAAGLYMYKTLTAPETLLSKGHDFYELKEYNQALNYYQKVLKKNPQNTEALIAIAKTLENTGKRGEAVDAYFKVLRVDPDNSEAYLRLGDLLYALGSRDKALQSYREVLRIEQSNIPALLGIARCFFDQKDWQKALDSYSQILLLEPGNMESLTQKRVIEDILAMHEEDEKRLEEESQILAQANEKKKTAQRALSLMAYSEAEQIYREVLLLNPRDWEAQEERKYCLEKMAGLHKEFNLYTRIDDIISKNLPHEEQRDANGETKEIQPQKKILRSEPLKKVRIVPVYSPRPLALSVEAEMKKNSPEELVRRMVDLSKTQNFAELLRTGWEYIFSLEKIETEELNSEIKIEKVRFFGSLSIPYKTTPTWIEPIIDNHFDSLQTLRRAIKLNLIDRKVYMMMSQAWEDLHKKNNVSLAEKAQQEEAFYSSLLAHAAYQSRLPEEAWDAIERAKQLAPDNLYIARLHLILANCLKKA